MIRVTLVGECPENVVLRDAIMVAYSLFVTAQEPVELVYPGEFIVRMEETNAESND